MEGDTEALAELQGEREARALAVSARGGDGEVDAVEEAELQGLEDTQAVGVGQAEGEVLREEHGLAVSINDGEAAAEEDAEGQGLALALEEALPVTEPPPPPFMLLRVPASEAVALGVEEGEAKPLGL